MKPILSVFTNKTIKINGKEVKIAVQTFDNVTTEACEIAGIKPDTFKQALETLHKIARKKK